MAISVCIFQFFQFKSLKDTTHYHNRLCYNISWTKTQHKKFDSVNNFQKILKPLHNLHWVIYYNCYFPVYISAPAYYDPWNLTAEKIENIASYYLKLIFCVSATRPVPDQSSISQNKRLENLCKTTSRIINQGNSSIELWHILSISMVKTEKVWVMWNNEFDQKAFYNEVHQTK